MNSRPLLAALAALSLCSPSLAEDGYDLWLRYSATAPQVPDTAVTSISAATETATPVLVTARAELERGLDALLRRDMPLLIEATPSRDDAIVLGTERSPLIASLGLPLSGLNPEGYVIRSTTVAGKRATVIAGKSDAGALYGVYHLLRLLQTGQSLAGLDIRSQPKTRLRLLNHWDNLDQHVERGYSGQSIWNWHKLPGWIDPRYVDYARACASIGINGTVLTNVNANATSLSPAYIAKVKALAGAMRPYGIRVYLTARFSAPIELGKLKTADPHDPAVRAWWKAKAAEIYGEIPDFGGFLVKANSEGQPGPQDYQRSHADGANMLAEAVAPHGGLVMWRAFVYSHETPRDRAMQAYDEFVPLDGKFHENVLVQVKNGAIDFQPREPFHPLFGAMPKTPLMMEFQITKEYLGFATHLAYLGPLFEEALDADTFVKGKGSTVARVVTGDLHGYRITGMAGVANVGSDRNWSGSIFDQANWYAYGRLAWDPELSARAIAEEWARMTFTHDPRFLQPVVDMMMGSREAVVDYMTPLGLAHLMGTGHHYGPAPWVNDLGRADWNPTYYHRADADGIGFDRGPKGSHATSQYAPPLARQFSDPKKTPEQFLLWFHHLPWTHRVASGRTLWDELVVRYTRGVDQVTQMQKTWEAMRPWVDAERFEQVKAYLAIQREEAQWWRDACIAYFQSINKLPLPAGYAPPQHSLEYYQSLQFPYAPGRG